MSDEPAIELLLTDRRGWAESPARAAQIAGELPPAPLWRQAEARLLAQRVAELVAAGEVAAGDVVVLLRAAGDLAGVRARAAGARPADAAPRSAASGATSRSVTCSPGCARWPTRCDELALYATLASPLVGISSDGLALLALRRARRGRSVGRAAKRGRRDRQRANAQLPDADRERLRRFIETFARERRRARARASPSCCCARSRVSGYERHVLSLELGRAAAGRTSTSCCASPAASRPPRVAACAASSTTSRIAARLPREPSPRPRPAASSPTPSV